MINGSEKVLIAQERMANNHVYVFRKSQPSKFSLISECRCASCPFPRHAWLHLVATWSAVTPSIGAEACEHASRTRCCPRPG